jgi:hypothetical protein
MKKQWHPVPQIAYDKFKIMIHRNIWIHFFFHTFFCPIKDIPNDNVRIYTPKKWYLKFRRVKK